MTESIYPDYPPDITEQRLQELCSTVNDWAVAHGLAVRPPPDLVSKEIDPTGSLAVTAPVTLFPSLFPRSCFEEAVQVQRDYSLLYAAIASDEAWLESVIKE